MHLSRKDCELYYQQQVGGNYFQGAPYQRGYGFFGDLKRYITPLVFRAGKYLGKQMLETGKNVFNDYTSGNSLKDSMRTRLRQTSKQIKDDFFQKLQQGKDKAPIEFLISGNGEHYLDLAHTILHLQVKIVKKAANAVLTDTDHVAPINYILNTMFSQFSIFLNDKQIASQSNYSYRAFMESLLFSSKSNQDSLQSSALFYKDTAAEHDNVAGASANNRFIARKNRCKLSKTVDLIGILHFDLASQPKLLINGVDVKIKLERHKDTFSLMSSVDDFKLVIGSASLFIRKINVAPSIVLAHEKALERGVIKIPIRRSEVRSFALSNGLQSSTIANAFIGQIPTCLILGFVSNAAYNGSVAKNPFKFHHYNLNYLSILDGSKMIPAIPFQPNFESNLYARSYLSLFTDLNRFHNSQNININYEEYKGGYSLYAVDLTPDLAFGECHTSVNRIGNIAIDLKFALPLPETVSLIVYAQYRNTIEIDKSRNVFTDY
ncbi:Uncharacterized protein F54H12.2 [Araneus ventricosus]|uniref:Uncharacterized protein F54H12.2 n=1 Tax=Araneus ventricosus TaxID=182803 RepID=A0A4Y2VXF2_ARAVE|nr:Uncharacterized protein F54H12.2 [Araneus ventricosus]